MWRRLLPPSARAWACARSLSSRAPSPLFEMPALSSRRERLQKQGLVALTPAFTRQQAASKRALTENSMIIQNYTVRLDRPAEFALTAVYGYGRIRSKRLAANLGIFGNYKLSRMRESQRSDIKRIVNGNCISFEDPTFAAGAALMKEVSLNIQRLKDINCYRGTRHKLRLPSRGQRTKTNARTRRRVNPLN